jgi:hypothetical protein
MNSIITDASFSKSLRWQIPLAICVIPPQRGQGGCKRGAVHGDRLPAVTYLVLNDPARSAMLAKRFVAGISANRVSSELGACRRISTANISSAVTGNIWSLR